MEKRQIPNILSAIRLLAVPVFVVVFFSDLPHANLLKKRKDIVVSSWYGKAASAIFACTVTALLLLWENYAVTLALSILLGIVILFAFIMYYIKIFRGKYGLKTPRQP